MTIPNTINTWLNTSTVDVIDYIKESGLLKGCKTEQEYIEELKKISTIMDKYQALYFYAGFLEGGHSLAKDIEKHIENK